MPNVSCLDESLDAVSERFNSFFDELDEFEYETEDGKAVLTMLRDSYGDSNWDEQVYYASVKIISQLRGRMALDWFYEDITLFLNEMETAINEIRCENNKLNYSPRGMITRTYTNEEVENLTIGFLESYMKAVILGKKLSESLKSKNDEWWGDTCEER